MSRSGFGFNWLSKNEFGFNFFKHQSVRFEFKRSGFGFGSKPWSKNVNKPNNGRRNGSLHIKLWNWSWKTHSLLKIIILCNPPVYTIKIKHKIKFKFYQQYSARPLAYMNVYIQKKYNTLIKIQINSEIYIFFPL